MDHDRAPPGFLSWAARVAAINTSRKPFCKSVSHLYIYIYIHASAKTDFRGASAAFVWGLGLAFSGYLRVVFWRCWVSLLKCLPGSWISSVTGLRLKMRRDPREATRGRDHSTLVVCTNFARRVKVWRTHFVAGAILCGAGMQFGLWNCVMCSLWWDFTPLHFWRAACTKCSFWRLDGSLWRTSHKTCSCWKQYPPKVSAQRVCPARISYSHQGCPQQECRTSSPRCGASWAFGHFRTQSPLLFVFGMVSRQTRPCSMCRSWHPVRTDRSRSPDLLLIQVCRTGKEERDQRSHNAT